jgi:hypothetical protein
MSEPIKLRTDCIYVCTDSANGEVRLLLPKALRDMGAWQLELDCPDPYGPNGNDKAEYQLLKNEMIEWEFDL